MKTLLITLFLIADLFAAIYPINIGEAGTSAELTISSPSSDWNFHFYQNDPDNYNYWGICQQGTKAQVKIYHANGSLSTKRDSSEFAFLNDVKNINTYQTNYQGTVINYIIVQTTTDTLKLILNQGTAFGIQQSFYFPHDLTTKYVQAYADSLYILCQDTLYSVFNTAKTFIADNVKSFYKNTKLWIGNSTSLDIFDGSRTQIKVGSYLEHLIIIENDTTIFYSVSDKLYDNTGFMYIQNPGGSTSRIELIQLLNANNDIYMIARHDPISVGVFDTLLLKFDHESQTFSDLSGLLFTNNLGKKIQYLTSTNMKIGSAGYVYTVTLNHTPLASSTSPDSLTWSNVITKTIDYAYSINVVDDNDNDFNYSSLQAPSWFSIPSSGSSVSENLNVVADTGTFYFQIQISDGTLNDTIDWYSTIWATWTYDTSYTYDTTITNTYDTTITSQTVYDTITTNEDTTYIDTVFTTTQIAHKESTTTIDSTFIITNINSTPIEYDTAISTSIGNILDTTTTIDTVIHNYSSNVPIDTIITITFDTLLTISLDTNITIDTVYDTLIEATKITYYDTIFTMTDIITTDEQIVTTTQITDIIQTILLQSDTIYQYDTTYTFDTTSSIDTIAHEEIEWLTGINPNSHIRLRPTVNIKIFSLNGRLIMSRKITESPTFKYPQILRNNLAAGQYIAITTKKKLSKTFKLSIRK